LQQQSAESSETLSAYKNRFLAVKEAVKERDSLNEKNTRELQLTTEKNQAGSTSFNLKSSHYKMNK
jgi:hypothetical protein